MSEAEDPTRVATTRQVESPPTPGERGCLRAVVMHDDLVETFPLPQSGTVGIGRLPGSDIRIDHPSVSRKHAVLHLGRMLALVDLGSANGTRLRGSALVPQEAVQIVPGDVVEFGRTMMVLQQVPHLARPTRLLSHAYFEARLEEACAQASRTGSSFAVLRIHAERQEPGRVHEALARALRPADLVARYGPKDYEVLFLDTSSEDAIRFAAQAGTLLADAGILVRSGLACFPRDGRSPEALLARACANVLGGEAAEAGVGPAVVVDPAMQRLYDLARRVAPSPINVLILGETGVGKEVLAEELHRSSPRADKPFLKINCGSLSEALLESELFGHERGAFTGAVQTKPGLLETAGGGTVFLDEIGELPASVQVKLLSALEDGQVLRVGGLKPRAIDVRFVAATNRELEAEVAAGRFRADLYYRLNGITLMVPPLRERVTEIEPLARAFLTRVCQRMGTREPDLSAEALGLLGGYGWPGNIRELRNFMERAALLCGGGPIRPEHLPTDKMGSVLQVTTRAASGMAGMSGPSDTRALPGPFPASTPRDLRAETEALERQRILEVLEQCGGNQTRAAELLNMPRRTLLRRLEQFRIPRPRRG